MKFTVTKKYELDEDAVSKVAEEFAKWLDQKNLLAVAQDDSRSCGELAEEWVAYRNVVVKSVAAEVSDPI